MARRNKISELEETLVALQEEAAQGKPRVARQLIPIRVVENVQLQAVTPDAIRRRLQGGEGRAGRIVGLEWFLLDSDDSTAIYAAKCPYEWCNGKGDIVASTRIGKSGKAELPFTDPGALCCDTCDTAIEALYEVEAARMR